MNILSKRLQERLMNVLDVHVAKDGLISIPQDAAVVLNYGGYPQNEIALINKLQNQQQVEQALARIKTNLQNPSVTAEDATFEALSQVKSRYLQEPSEVQDYIMRRLDEVGAFVPKDEVPVEVPLEVPKDEVPVEVSKEEVPVEPKSK